MPAFLIFCLFFAKINETAKHRGQHYVKEEFENKVQSDEEDDEVAADRHSLCRSPRVDRVHKEDKATDKEYPRIDNGRNHRRNDNGNITVEF